MSNLGNKEIMAKNIREYLDRKGITGKDLANAIGVPPTTVYSWLQGQAYPRIDKIELMAKYFGVSKSTLVEDHTDALDQTLQEAFDRRPEMRALFSVAEGCTPEEIEQAIKIIEALKR